MLVKKNVWSNKFLVRQNFWSKKILVKKNFWKKILVKKIIGQKKILVEKTFGWKFIFVEPPPPLFRKNLHKYSIFLLTPSLSLCQISDLQYLPFCENLGVFVFFFLFLWQGKNKVLGLRLEYDNRLFYLLGLSLAKM